MGVFKQQGTVLFKGIGVGEKHGLSTDDFAIDGGEEGKNRGLFGKREVVKLEAVVFHEVFALLEEGI